MPKAQQITDRWHLVHNLTEAHQQLIQHYCRAIRDCAKELNEQFRTASAVTVSKMEEPIVPPTASEYMRTRAQQATRQAFHQRRRAMTRSNSSRPKGAPSWKRRACRPEQYGRQTLL